MRWSKGIISSYIILTAAGLTMASPLTPYTKTCPAYKKTIKRFSDLRAGEKSLSALSEKKGCPSKQTAVLDAALNLYDRGDYRRSMDMAGRIDKESLLPTASLCMARASFHMGKLAKSMEILDSIIKKGVLRAPAMALKLRLLCRIGRCKQGITETLSGIEGLDDKNLFRIRMMLVQALFETGGKQRAISLGEYLYFNSFGEREKVVMKVLRLIDPLRARTAYFLKRLFDSKKSAKFIMHNYHSLKKLPMAWDAVMQIRNTERQAVTWAAELAQALKKDRADDGNPMISLVKSGKWFPLFPKAIDRVCTGYCDSLAPDDATKILQIIPIETGYRPIARMKLGMCMLQQGLNTEAARLLSGHVHGQASGLVFGLREKILSLSALAAMRESRMEEAVRAWKRLSQAWPYTYLAVLAKNRLHAFGRKAAPIKAKSLVHDLSPLGKTGLELLRMGHPNHAIELLTSVRSAGMMNAADTQVLASLLKIHRGLRAKLAEYLRGAPYRHMKRLFHSAWPRAYKRQINLAAKRIRIPVSLLLATARAESRFRAWAVSRTGAYGLMQVQRHTAIVVARHVLKRPGMARSLFFPMNSLLIGGHYLKILVDHFNNYLPLALVAYNAGLSSANTMFARSKGMPTELFVIRLRPKIVRFYVEQILNMSPAYGFLYHTPIPGCRLMVPQKLIPFTVKLSVEP